jgi:XrtJ-associated TM-motif-TM protein
MKKTLLSLAFVLTLAAALPLRAQDGCVDSPEDPTVFLALVAGAGALVAGARASRKDKP